MNPRARLRPVTVVLAMAMLIAAPAFGPRADAAAAAAGELQIVEHTDHKDYGEVGNPDFRPAISADGRFIAYVPTGEDEGNPLLLHDMSRDTTTTVLAPAGLYKETIRPALSANGRYLAFDSNAPALLGKPKDESTDIATQVAVYDRRTGHFNFVSHRSGRHGKFASYGNSSRPSISADGSRVAFETESQGLSTNRRETIGGIYERDLATETLRPVSAVPGFEFWTPGSWGPALSGDGRRVAFTFEYGRDSYDPAHPPRHLESWLRDHPKEIMESDRAWDRPRVVSRADGRDGARADGKCGEAAISKSGRYVAFVSKAHNLVPGDGDGVADVFVRDVKTDRTTLVSTNATGRPIANGKSSQPSISADGEWVAFLSEADNLVPGDEDPGPDVYAKNLRTGRLVLVTRGLEGKSSEGRSGGPAISADGRYIAFGSTDSNLDPEVTDHDLTFYRYRLG